VATLYVEGGKSSPRDLSFEGRPPMMGVDGTCTMVAKIANVVENNSAYQRMCIGLRLAGAQVDDPCHVTLHVVGGASKGYAKELPSYAAPPQPPPKPPKPTPKPKPKQLLRQRRQQRQREGEEEEEEEEEEKDEDQQQQQQQRAHGSGAQMARQPSAYEKQPHTQCLRNELCLRPKKHCGLCKLPPSKKRELQASAVPVPKRQTRARHEQRDDAGEQRLRPAESQKAPALRPNPTPTIETPQFGGFASSAIVAPRKCSAAALMPGFFSSSPTIGRIKPDDSKASAFSSAAHLASPLKPAAKRPHQRLALMRDDRQSATARSPARLLHKISTPAKQTHTGQRVQISPINTVVTKARPSVARIRTSSGKTKATFPEMLWTMLEDDDCDEQACVWMPNGLSFYIRQEHVGAAMRKAGFQSTSIQSLKRQVSRFYCICLLPPPRRR
jgi:hypothetical protein